MSWYRMDILARNMLQWLCYWQLPAKPTRPTSTSVFQKCGDCYTSISDSLSSTANCLYYGHGGKWTSGMTPWSPTLRNVEYLLINDLQLTREENQGHLHIQNCRKTSFKIYVFYTAVHFIPHFTLIYDISKSVCHCTWTELGSLGKIRCLSQEKDTRSSRKWCWDRHLNLRGTR
jgi:hypothetical protein